MDKKAITKRRWHYLKAYAKYRRLSEEDAQDFAQDAAIEIANGRKSQTAQIFIDWLRKKTEWSRASKSRRATFLEYKVHGSDTNDEFISSLNAYAWWEKEGVLDDFSGIDTDRFISKIADKEARVLMRLRYKWEFNLVELAILFDVSESRISQLLTKALQDIRKDISKPKDAEL